MSSFPFSPKRDKIKRKILPTFARPKVAKVTGRGEIVLKIIASSLNLIPTPPPDKIFNAHPLDFFNANFDVPERCCFAAIAARNMKGITTESQAGPSFPTQ
jgi:hypothetical protein